MTVVLLWTLLVLFGCARLGSAPSGAADPEADRLAGQLLGNLGGPRELGRIAFLRYHFVESHDGRELERRGHWWDRSEGRYRLTDLRQGRLWVALLNIRAARGIIFEGQPPQASDQPGALTEALALQMADSLWLTVPTRLRESGSQLTVAAEQSIAGQRAIGLDWTPPPIPGRPAPQPIRLWFEPDGTRLLGWTLPAQEPAGTPELWLITQWQQVRGFNFPVQWERQGIQGRHQIQIENLLAPATIDDAVFGIP